MISIEPLVIQIRKIKDGGQFGDPYTWTTTGVRIAPGVLEIVGSIVMEDGTMKAPTPSTWHEMKAALHGHGWKKVVFRRMRGNCEIHQVELE